MVKFPERLDIGSIYITTRLKFGGHPYIHDYVEK
jgi:hypothetical protein